MAALARVKSFDSAVESCSTAPGCTKAGRFVNLAPSVNTAMSGVRGVSPQAATERTRARSVWLARKGTQPLDLAVAQRRHQLEIRAGTIQPRDMDRPGPIGHAQVGIIQSRDHRGEVWSRDWIMPTCA